jgi:hypothetical protein
MLFIALEVKTKWKTLLDLGVNGGIILKLVFRIVNRMQLVEDNVQWCAVLKKNIEPSVFSNMNMIHAIITDD